MHIPTRDGESDTPSNVIDLGSLELRRAQAFESGSLGSVDANGCQHNHDRSITSSAHPSHRRLTTPVRATIESTSRRVGIRARDVRAVVEQQHPDTVFTQRDIYNARAVINREKLGGYTPTGSLIKLFDELKIPYLVKWDADQPNRLLGLVWTFPYCLQTWKRFPEVISFDNTYNTNRFKLPLFQATGQTCLGTVFNAAFGLIDCNGPSRLNGGCAAYH
ncbi:PKS-NRPS hybrid synthetase [Metarhizium anisopliae]|nr:PKS-NRPS hybrid synthetase [Metarhizium anisopliae]